MVALLVLNWLWFSWFCIYKFWKLQIWKTNHKNMLVITCPWLPEGTRVIRICRPPFWTATSERRGSNTKKDESFRAKVWNVWRRAKKCLLIKARQRRWVEFGGKTQQIAAAAAPPPGGQQVLLRIWAQLSCWDDNLNTDVGLIDLSKVRNIQEKRGKAY